MRVLQPGALSPRQTLVDVALGWERTYGVAPSITCTISEYDAAMLVGLSDEEYAAQGQSRTAVMKGVDFIHRGLRFQVKANRPSGKPGSPVTLVSKAKNFDWDRLIWLLYDSKYVLQEAWEWEVTAYRARFEFVSRLGPREMRLGKCIFLSTASQDRSGVRRSRA